jgi:hypothetical protein
MLKFLIIYLISFGVTLLIGMKKGNSFIPITETYFWSKRNLSGTVSNGRINSFTKNTNGYKISNQICQIHTAKCTPILDDSLVDLPFLGEGFYTYKKIGSLVKYFSRDGELLWQKDFHSYPKSNANGEITLLLSGDQNQILLIDRNANPVGEGEIHGRFFVDIQMNDIDDQILILFSGGEIFKINQLGQVLLKKDLSVEKGIRFLKSGYIGNGYFLIHLLEDDFDQLVSFDEKGDENFRFKLSQIYPYKIFVASLDKNSTAIRLPQKILFIDGKGTQKSSIQIDEDFKIYNPIFSSGNLYYTQVGDSIQAFDRNGKLIRKISLEKGSSPLRFLPTAQKDSFWIETQNDLILFAKEKF